MSRKAHSMVVLSELSSLFVKISICDALSSHDLFNDMSECVCHDLTQGIRTIKTFIKYKSATGDKFATQNKRKQCRILGSL